MNAQLNMYVSFDIGYKDNILLSVYAKQLFTYLINSYAQKKY